MKFKQPRSGRGSSLILFGLGTVATCVGASVCIKDYFRGKRYGGKIRLHGKTVVITGANEGIGRELAEDFANKGARVIMACRDIDKGGQTKADIVMKTYNRNVVVRKLDLSSFNSVRRFAEDTIACEPMIHILVLNAGVMHVPKRRVTEDGIEMHMSTNYFGHFLLTNLLLDKMKKSSPSRIIVMSCKKYSDGKINFDDLNLEQHYDCREAYSQSKLSLVMFARHLAKKLEGSSVTVNVTDPGWIVNTRFHKYEAFRTFIPSRIFYSPIFWLYSWSPRQGAFTPVYAAVDPLLEKTTGKYFRDCMEVDFAENSLDDADCERLWKTSELWTKLHVPIGNIVSGVTGTRT